MARFATRAVTVSLVWLSRTGAVNQEQPHFRRQRAVVVKRVPSSRVRAFPVPQAALHSLANLAVLYGAERAFSVCIKIPAVSQGDRARSTPEAVRYSSLLVRACDGALFWYDSICSKRIPGVMVRRCRFVIQIPCVRPVPKRASVVRLEPDGNCPVAV